MKENAGTDANESAGSTPPAVFADPIALSGDEVVAVPRKLLEEARADLFGNSQPWITEALDNILAQPSPSVGVEEIARVLATSLCNAIGTDFTGEISTAVWPKDYGPNEQAGFRLVANRILSALRGETVRKGNDSAKM